MTMPDQPLRARLATGGPIRLTRPAPSDRGICGAFAPTLADGCTPICTLMAEHPGWHGDREGMSWSDGYRPSPGHALAQVDVDNAWNRGYQRGVAEGRRQATEAWTREWGTAFNNGGSTWISTEEAHARELAARYDSPTAYVVSRLVGPWEAVEQDEPCPRIAHESGVVLACRLNHEGEPAHLANRHANPAHRATWDEDDDRIVAEPADLDRADHG